MNKTMIRVSALLSAILLLVVSMPLSAAATEGYEVNNCFSVVTEPEAMSGAVTYYKDGVSQDFSAMTWVDNGVHGKALVLDGQSEYLEIGFSQLRLAQMTFATWINFGGAVDETNPASAYGQRLFTISSGSDRYFTVSPHVVDATLTHTDGGQLDGIYMEYYRGDSEDGGTEFSMNSFTGARAGQSNFGLPQNEWHHIAVVADGQTARLYVDGNLILDEILMMGIVQMYADSMTIGKGLWNDPLLNATLDDTMMFDVALTQEQIGYLMETGDAAGVTTGTTTTESIYLPTSATVTAAVTESTTPSDKPEAPFGLPIWGFCVVIGLLVVFVVLTVAVNVYESRWRTAHPEEQRAREEEKAAEPSISIKEAAKRKRQEEHEKFLSEEQQEKEKE